GWVILFGVLLGLPTAVIAGPLFGKYISARIQLNPPEILLEEEVQQQTRKNPGPSFGLVIALIVIPLFLILVSTFVKLGIDKQFLTDNLVAEILVFLGHPFTALIIATLLSMYFLCIRRGMSKQKVLDLSTKALGPAGIIILITGAGGVLKEILVDSGIGKLMAESIHNSSFPVIFLAWILAAIIRITQGSATVAMITAAGIIAPAISLLNLSDAYYALVVISIASGATILSHFNDSGFWLVSRFFGMDEKQTLRSWSVMETIISICGLCFCLLASLFID
ncbi:MAG: gluconate transporter, partial [Bacteroidales bacterium]|nr:gluconate transporter [Bacteroidales bacterium]